jgi:hypothetical protein
MLRRSKRINDDYTCKEIEYLTNEVKIFKTKTTQERIKILNQYYIFTYLNFYGLRHYMHNTTNGKENSFIIHIKTLEEKGFIFLDQIRELDNGHFKLVKALKQNIVKTCKKIRKYIDTYNNDKKEAYILLSCRIGFDLMKHIKSYL